jgi:hypothetical protein
MPARTRASSRRDARTPAAGRKKINRKLCRGKRAPLGTTETVAKNITISRITEENEKGEEPEG